MLGFSCPKAELAVAGMLSRIAGYLVWVKGPYPQSNEADSIRLTDIRAIVHGNPVTCQELRRILMTEEHDQDNHETDPLETDTVATDEPATEHADNQVSDHTELGEDTNVVEAEDELADEHSADLAETEDDDSGLLTEDDNGEDDLSAVDGDEDQDAGDHYRDRDEVKRPTPKPKADAGLKPHKSATKAGKGKKKVHYNPGKTPPKPIELKDHSPWYIPWIGTTLIVVSLILLVINYVVRGLPPFYNGWLIVSFIGMTLGLIVLSRWK